MRHTPPSSSARPAGGIDHLEARAARLKGQIETLEDDLRRGRGDPAARGRRVVARGRGLQAELDALRRDIDALVPT